MDKSRIVVISNYHRPFKLFDKTLEMLHNHGYINMVILNTAVPEWTKLKTALPIETVSDGHKNYFQGMQTYKRLLEGRDFDYILQLDNDMWMSGTDYLDRLVDETIASDYDYVSFYNHPYFYDQEEITGPSDTLIRPVLKQEIRHEEPDGPLIVCNPAPRCKESGWPWPYWENAYQLISKKAWDNLSIHDVSYGRLFIAGLLRDKAKLGAIEATYLGENWSMERPVSQYGEEWAHLGDLMFFYYMIERNTMRQAETRSTMDYQRARLGCILEHQELLPSCADLSYWGTPMQCSGAWAKLQKELGM